MDIKSMNKTQLKEMLENMESQIGIVKTLLEENEIPDKDDGIYAILNRLCKKGFIDNLKSKIKDNKWLSERFEQEVIDKFDSDDDNESDVEEYIKDFLLDYSYDLLNEGVFDKYPTMYFKFATLEDILNNDFEMDDMFERNEKDAVKAFYEVHGKDFDDTDDDEKQYFYSKYFPYHQTWREDMNVAYCYREDYIDDLVDLFTNHEGFSCDSFTEFSYDSDGEVDSFMSLLNNGKMDLTDSDIRDCISKILNDGYFYYNDGDKLSFISENATTLLEYMTKGDLFDMVFEQ